MSGPTTPFSQQHLPAMRVIVQATICAGFALMLSTEVLVSAEPAGRSDAHDSAAAIRIAADVAQEWSAGSERAMVLRGNCRVRHGQTTFRSEQAVVWHWTAPPTGAMAALRGAAPPRERVSVYLEGNVRVDQPGRSTVEPTLFVALETRRPVEFTFPHRRELVAQEDPLFDRGLRRRRLSGRQTLLQTQLVVEDDAAPLGPVLQPQLLPQPGDGQLGGLRRVRIFPRGSQFFVESRPSDQTTPPEQVWIVKGGVNMLIDGVEQAGIPDVSGVVDLSADRMIIWTRTGDITDLQAELTQTPDTPLQVYMEGNIVIRQGRNVLKASHAFYDAQQDRALMLNAELRAFVPELQGDIRIRAERMRQLSRKSYHAQNAWTTASRFGRPGYRLQASDIMLDYRPQNPWIGFGGPPQIDPQTGAEIVEETPWLTTLNNQFFIEDVPLLYVPQLSGPAEDPNIPIRSATIENDDIFGTQIRTVWNLSKILSLDLPPDTEWDLLVDYLSKRGPAVGTGGRYRGVDPAGVPGSYLGLGLGYYIYDDGRDNLGADRRSLTPESRNRGRIRWEHRQDLPYGMILFGQLGYITDRNFLEQYDESEFDRGIDQNTELELKQDIDNWSWSLMGRVQTNPFENTTEWYPRFDLYGLSEPLFGSPLNWTSHTSLGYARLNQAEAPTNPNDLFVPLPYFADSEGAVLMTRHELDVPFHFGPVHFDPFVGGEAAFWDQGLAGNDLERLVGTAGVRSSLTFWRVFPHLRSRAFNLNGLAHKIVLGGEYAYTDASRSINDIAQYNEFDDNAQERFRQRLAVNTFGGVVPPQFEPRFYAIRSGAGSWVTAPYHELVDDQQVARLSLRQRLQTKVGPPERRRIKDWMILDLGASYYPDADRDNFGEEVGLLYGRYEWNVGERTKLLGSALYDVFEGGQELWDAGVLTQRSTRGSLYLGFRQVKGATLDSLLFTTSFSYAMSSKWISTFGSAYDIAENQNRGQSLTITRVGADWIVHIGANYDRSKNNAGIAISVEPRFGPFDGTSTQLSSLLGLR